MRIALICFDGMEELDLVGPWEVLRMWQLQFPGDGVEVVTVSLSDEIVECAKGMKIVTDLPVSEFEGCDVLLFPGGQGTRRMVGDPDVSEWLRNVAGEGTLMTSVCTGSLVFAGAGLLKNRPATTYWSQLDTLKEIDRSIEVRRDDRFVDSGEVITSSGVSAGIDMALHLVRRLQSEDRARQVKKAIQYDPEPPV